MTSVRRASVGAPSWTFTAVTVIWILALVVSGVAPYDRITWFMEVAPVLIVLSLLLATPW